MQFTMRGTPPYNPVCFNTEVGAYTTTRLLAPRINNVDSADLPVFRAPPTDSVGFEAEHGNDVAPWLLAFFVVEINCAQWCTVRTAPLCDSVGFEAIVASPCTSRFQAARVDNINSAPLFAMCSAPSSDSEFEAVTRLPATPVLTFFVFHIDGTGLSMPFAPSRKSLHRNAEITLPVTLRIFT